MTQLGKSQAQGDLPQGESFGCSVRATQPAGNTSRERGEQGALEAPNTPPARCTLTPTPDPSALEQNQCPPTENNVLLKVRSTQILLSHPAGPSPGVAVGTEPPSCRQHCQEGSLPAAPLQDRAPLPTEGLGLLRLAFFFFSLFLGLAVQGLQK